MAIKTNISISTNALTSEQIRIINLLYPIGTYYETSDNEFDPNLAWAGTWVKTSGRWHRTG